MELSARRGLVRQWVAVTTLAWMAGVLLAGGLWRSNADVTCVALGGTLIGVLLGMLQWLVLRTHLRISPWWAVVTAAVLGPLSYGVAQVWPGGLIFPYMPGGLIEPYMPLPHMTEWWPQGFLLPLWVRLWVLGPVVGLVWGSVTGALLGAAQWLLLRRRPGAGRWVVANAVGLGAGFAAGAVALACFALALRSIRLSDAAAVWVLMAAVGVRGAVSGAITARMLPSATPVEQEELGGATPLRARRELVQQWVVVTALGWAMGGLLAMILSLDAVESATAMPLWGVLSGAVLGLLQWLVLRPHLRISLWWAAATAGVLGLLSYGAVQILLYMGDGPSVSSFVGGSYLWTGVVITIGGLVLGSVAGAFQGAAQWLLLRRQRLEAGRWVVANIVGQGAALAAGAAVLSCLMLAFVSIDLPSSTITDDLFVWFFTAAMGVGGAVSGAITARALPPPTGMQVREPGGATPLRARRELAQEWVLVTALGWAEIGLLAVLYHPYDKAAIVALGSVSGALLGLLQWLGLRRHLRISLWWVAATAAVLGLLFYGGPQIWRGGLIFLHIPGCQNSSAACFYLQQWVAFPIVGLVLGSVAGALLGAAQWLLLGRQRPDALRWMAANVVGLGVGLAASAVVCACLAVAGEYLSSDIMPGVQVVVVMAAVGVAGAVSGAITARALPRATVMEVEEPGEATPLPARRGLAWQWVAITALAWMVGGLLAGVVLSSRSEAEITAVALGGILSGAVLGVLQWLVLRPHLRISLWWAAATAAVLALLSYRVAQTWRGGLTFPYVPDWYVWDWMLPRGSSVASFYRELWKWPFRSQAVLAIDHGRWVASPIMAVALGGVTGAVLGAVQWLLLRRERPGAWRWVAANVMGLGVGLAAGTVVFTWLMLALLPAGWPGAVTVAIVAGAGVRGVVSGAITARTLLRLL